MAKMGVYQGGIRDLNGLKDRCFVDDMTGCWHWRLHTFQGIPFVHMIQNGKRVKQRGRRAALLLAGVEIKKGHLAWARACCQSEDCVNPEHSRSGTKKAWGEALAASGKVKGLPSKIEAARASAVHRRKMTEEMVSEVLSSTESDYKLAKKMGVSAYAIWSWRNRKPKGSSVFNWRG